MQKTIRWFKQISALSKVKPPDPYVVLLWSSPGQSEQYQLHQTKVWDPERFALHQQIWSLPFGFRSRRWTAAPAGLGLYKLFRKIELGVKGSHRINSVKHRPFFPNQLTSLSFSRPDLRTSVPCHLYRPIWGHRHSQKSQESCTRSQQVHNKSRRGLDPSRLRRSVTHKSYNSGRPAAQVLGFVGWNRPLAIPMIKNNKPSTKQNNTKKDKIKEAQKKTKERHVFNSGSSIASHSTRHLSHRCIGLMSSECFFIGLTSFACPEPPLYNINKAWTSWTMWCSKLDSDAVAFFLTVPAWVRRTCWMVHKTIFSVWPTSGFLLQWTTFWSFNWRRLSCDPLTKRLQSKPCFKPWSHA